MAHIDDHWFTDRPARKSKCPRCRGCGVVQESYALTPATIPKKRL